MRSSQGNVLWDCISLLDDEIVETVRRLGGIAAIAISHPHYYSSMVEWASTFDAPVYLHSADREWIMRPDPCLVLWDGERHEPLSGISLLRLGGHFAGATVLHWPAGAAGHGALLSGDVVQVVPDRRWVSFMRSYPNLIPLAAAEVERIAAALALLDFERVYGAWYGRVVTADGKAAIERSARRYLLALSGAGGD